MRTAMIGRSAGALLVVGLALSGCGLMSRDDSGGGSSAGSQSSQTSQGEDVEKDSAVEAGIDWTDPPEPIATVTFLGAESGGSQAELKLDLLGVTRRDNVLLVNYAVTPNAKGPDARSLYQWMGDQSPRPRLIDTKNLNLYEPLTADGAEMATDAVLGSDFSDGQTFYAYAMFSAPPPDVTHIDVAISDSAPTFQGVEIQ